MATSDGKLKIGNTIKSSTLYTNDMPKSSALHMASAPEIYEPQRSNNFEFKVDLTTALLPNGKTTGADSTTITLAVSSTTVPHFSQSPIEIRRGNNSIKYAGTPSFNSGRISINDYIGLPAKNALLAWQTQSYNINTQKVGLAGDYKKDAILSEYSPDYQLVRQWRMIGCWISDLSEDDYNNESNNVHTVSATIQYDRAELIGTV